MDVLDVDIGYVQEPLSDKIRVFGNGDANF